MAQSDLVSTRLKPEVSQLLQLHVLRSERISEHFMRVTLGGGDIDRFGYMGFDQWFRLFLPIKPGSLARLPQKLTSLAYAKYLTIPKQSRPVLRNYTVRGYRPDGAGGPELDVDFVVHGTPEEGTAGPASTWAQRCAEGDSVAIIDEGVLFHPSPSVSRVFLVADESALPAAAGVLRSLPAQAKGHAVLEVPAAQDAQELAAPAGVEITWVVREDHHGVPGRQALQAVQEFPTPSEPFCGWTAGEQALTAGVRRHWIAAGVPKEHITFCGYWRAGQRR